MHKETALPIEFHGFLCLIEENMWDSLFANSDNTTFNTFYLVIKKIFKRVLLKVVKMNIGCKTMII